MMGDGVGSRQTRFLLKGELHTSTTHQTKVFQGALSQLVSTPQATLPALPARCDMVTMGHRTQPSRRPPKIEWPSTRARRSFPEPLN
eukprot:12322037-Alexandrium_andersonii.AAC.1